MTPDEVVTVVQTYQQILREEGFVPERLTDPPLYPTVDGSLGHILWMCEEIEVMAQDNLDKAFRWLGFVQGVLWTRGRRSIYQMRCDNKGLHEGVG